MTAQQANQRAQALAQPHAEVALNGRCVGQLYWDERYGTSLRFLWHDPQGCEHVALQALKELAAQ
jgi:hypothetical protein